MLGESSHHLFWACGHSIEATFNAKAGLLLMPGLSQANGSYHASFSGPCLCWPCGQLARAQKHAEAGCCLGFVDLWESLGNSQRDPRQVLFVEELLEYTGAQQAICVGWESQGIARTRQTVLAWLMRTQIWFPPVFWLDRKRVQQRNNGVCQHFCPRERCSHLQPLQTLSPKLGSLFPPCMSLVRFEQLPLYCESIGESFCGPFKTCSTLVSSSYCTFSLWDLNPHLFLQSDIVGFPLLGTDSLGWGAQCRAGTLHISGISTAKISFLLLNSLGMGPAHSTS